MSITLLACEIKSLIQFSVDGRGCLPSQLFGLRPNCGGGNEENGNLLQKIRCMHYCTQCPQPWSRPPPIHTSTRDSWTLTGKSGQSLGGSLFLSPGSWCTQVFVCALQESVSPVLCKLCNQIPWPPKSDSLGVLSAFQIPRLRNLL